MILIIGIAVVAIAFIVWHFHLLTSIEKDLVAVKTDVVGLALKADAAVKTDVATVETEIKKVL